MNFSKPLTWGIIGAVLGFLGALGGMNNSLADGIFGGLLQFFIWYGVSSLIINRKKNKSKE